MRASLLRKVPAEGLQGKRYKFGSVEKNRWSVYRPCMNRDVLYFQSYKLRGFKF